MVVVIVIILVNTVSVKQVSSYTKINALTVNPAQTVAYCAIIIPPPVKVSSIFE
jgi:hypothetical protein